MTLDIREMSIAELSALMEEMGLPSFRAGQIRTWLDKGVDFLQMLNLPQNLREMLATQFSIERVQVSNVLVSQRDNTRKYLFAMPDGEQVEGVLMHYRHGWSQCISTQAGCRMGCRFCATGLDGWRRHLTAAEMIGQIEAAQEEAGVRVGSVVLMGMGEPLDNYEQTVRFLRLLGEEGGVHIGMRHVSVSTCGLADGIRRLADEGLSVTLSVSLHAPNDTLREQMMPINRRYPLSELMAACDYWLNQTGRRISFEYALAAGINDADAHADALGKLMRRLCPRGRPMLCHVNLIPMNHVGASSLQRSLPERVRSFQQRVATFGVPVTVRRTLGSDIDASCGQLRTTNL